MKTPEVYYVMDVHDYVYDFFSKWPWYVRLIQNLEYELTLFLVPLHLQLNQCGGLAESKKDYDHDILVCTKPRTTI